MTSLSEKVNSFCPDRTGLFGFDVDNLAIIRNDLRCNFLQIALEMFWYLYETAIVCEALLRILLRAMQRFQQRYSNAEQSKMQEME